ncbi:MocR-like pyridoxine biosynthesis transcription factor PdxR [Peptostreptococcus faecalis]|uniref:MocR-like pyridoxine biosynthesis transcription factor PdxR n=1 Tax=Peptostreptococcus faecalis TaxID=2045015 RepID=UPI000C7AEC90|nr:PLP-dependent aminotransferase family protein [Peptostreptococcus faecalis]
MDIQKYDIFFDKNESKYLQIYNKIKEIINDGELKTGDKLPPIRKLADYLDVNSVTIVKAYQLLDSEGYVNKRMGSGTFVSGKHEKYSRLELKENENLYRLDTGNPSADIFPIDDFKKAINIALNEDSYNVFDYDDGTGILELKEVMIKYLNDFCIKSSVDNLFIISGAQQGIDIISKALINYSDVVFIEEPTYSGAINILKGRGAKIVPIPMLDDGIDIGILKLKIEKIMPKLVYIMPNFQNPTGISYSEYKKKKIVELAEEYDFYILEDDFISDFKFNSENNRTVKSYDIYNRVIYIKSFSKILMPGLRVGIMDVPSELIERVAISKYSSDISTSTLIQKSLFYYMDRFNWKKHISSVEKIYTRKFNEVQEYIEKKLCKKLKLIKTDGGINFFLELKRGYYSRDFVGFILDKGVAVQPGSIYYDNEIDDRFFRVNIARESTERIKKAIDIISDNLDLFYTKFSG